MQRPGLAPGMTAHFPGNRWKKAKEVFFNATGARKPKSKDFYGKVTKATEAMDKALVVVDAACNSPASDPAGLHALQTAKTGYVSARDSYLKLLHSLLATPPGEINAILYKNALATLERELRGIETDIGAEISHRNLAISGQHGLAVQYAGVVHEIHNALHEAQATLARIHANHELTVGEFNGEVEKLAREISAPLGHVTQLQTKGYTAAAAPPAAEVAYLNTWHTGGSASKLALTATRQDMEHALALVSQHLTALEHWANGLKS